MDRSVRSLVGLSGASSSRVLNLGAIAFAQADNPKHRAAPFFDSPILNSSIILKHRLRSDEMDLFMPRRTIATKVIFPFEKTDLRSGGRSLFVGQRGYEHMLQEIGNYGDKHDIKRDMEVLRLIDAVPSLDPFLLREHLHSHDIAPDACYFSISNADQQRMFDYAATEVRQLTALALSKKSTSRDASTDKIVAALSVERGNRAARAVAHDAATQRRRVRRRNFQLARLSSITNGAWNNSGPIRSGSCATSKRSARWARPTPNKPDT